MMHLLIAENRNPFFTHEFEKIEALLPPAEIEKAARYRNWQDRQARLLGRLLLLSWLQENNMPVQYFQSIQYSKYGRPCCINAGFDFNISHSGLYVICAVNTLGKVGVDIEEIKPIDPDEFCRVLTTREIELVKTAQKKERLFYKIWTRKEALGKADGRGLGVEWRAISVLENTVSLGACSYLLSELQVDENYQTSIAYEGKPDGFLLQKMDLKSLLK